MVEGSAHGKASETEDSTEKGEAGRRVLIVSASMGAGHLQVSHEMERRLAARGHDVRVADFNELMLGPTGGWLSRLYPWLVNQAPRLYDAVYRLFFLAPQRAGGRALVPTLLAMPRLRQLVDDFRPHVVVSTFHLAGLAVARLRTRGDLRCPAVTYITTFAVHNLWVHPDADEHLCISSAAAEDAVRRSGRPATACGPVVRQMFARPRSDGKQVRAELGLPLDSNVALIVAGSLGLGEADQTAATIAGHPGWTPVVACGRNESLRQKIDEAGNGIPLGWVDDMAGLMDAADVLIENAGGLSTKEAVYRGLPVVTYRPISGHGRDDAMALERLGLTSVVDDPSVLEDELDQLATEPDKRAERIHGDNALITGDPVREIERLAAGTPAAYPSGSRAPV